MAYSDDVIVGPAGTEISITDFGNPVKAHLDDLDTRDLARQSETGALRADLGTWDAGGTAITRITTLETASADHETRVGALEDLRDAYGRWYSTSTATHTSAAEIITGWTKETTPTFADVTVNGTTGEITINTTGVYRIVAAYHANHQWTLDQGANTNVFISNGDLSEVYCQSTGYRVQYTSGTLEAAETVSTGDLELTAGDIVEVHLGAAQAIALSGTASGYRRTFLAITRNA